MLNLRSIASQSRAYWKFFVSLFKNEWVIDDYPIHFRVQTVCDPSVVTRLKLIPWIASVINWPAMSGNGNTKLEALEELRRNFARFKSTKPKLPRPGTKVPIEFAETKRIDRHSELVGDFVQRVLEIDWAWISDESSLWDFHGDETNDRLNERIRHIYGVDVSDISKGNLADIFDRIERTRDPQDRVKRSAGP